MQIDPAAARLMRVLAQMAQASEEALKAGASGDDNKTRTASDTLRRLQAKLNNIDGTTRSKINELSSDLKTSVQENINRIKSAEPFIKNWCQRYRNLISFEILQKTAEGRQGIIDYALPLDWNFDTDVLILFGNEELAFIEELKKRGQIRILAVAVTQSKLLAGEIFYTNDKSQIRDYFSQIKPPKPTRMAMLSNENKISFQKEWEIVKHGFTLSISNSYTSELYGNSWLMQGLANLPSIARSMNMAALKTALNGMPMVIVSPGPSLDKNIHQLKEIKGHAVIIAAAQCAKALDSAGIVPDFIAVADPNNLVYFLDGLDISEVEGLIIGVSCHPGFYSKPFKNIITFNANANIDAWISDIFGDTLPISAAGSISIDCLYFAKFIESSCIIMVGLDLAISDGKTYSKNSANSSSKIIIDSSTETLSFTNVSKELEEVFLAKGAASEDAIERVLKLPGYYGGEVITRPNYHLFHSELVEIARLEKLQKKPTSLVNCTEGGAYIEGFEHIKLIEAIKRYLPKNKISIRPKMYEAYSAMKFAIREEKLAKAITEMQISNEKILKLVNQCRILINMKRGRDIKKLSKIEKELITEIKGMPYLSIPNSKQIATSMEMAKDVKDVQQTNDVANFIYDTLEYTSKSILTFLKENASFKPSTSEAQIGNHK